MKTEINLPENISEITLGQFLRYEELVNRDIDVYNFNKRKVEIFTNIPFKQVDSVKNVDIDRILNQIDTALATEAKFLPTFEFNGVKYGFIPNLDKITLAEYADLTKHGVSKDSLHNLMAILFRPIINEKGNCYDIMPYDGTEERAEYMKGMPLNCVNGALVFFYNLANELQKATQRYLEEELQKELQQKTISKSLAGTLLSRSWLGITYLGFRKSLS